MVRATQIHNSYTQLARPLASINFIRNLGAHHHTVERAMLEISLLLMFGHQVSIRLFLI